MSQEPKQLRVTQKKLTDYTPDPQNANAGTEVGSAFIEKSIRQFGAGRSVVVDRNRILIGGNKSQQAALDAGLVDVIEIETDGNQMVVVRRTDLDLIDDPEHKARMLAYFDNRASELSMRWDPGQMLLDHKAGVPLEEAFTKEDMLKILGHALANENAEAPDARIDQIEEVHARIGAKAGDLWLIPSKSGLGGAHRLVCGDSTDAETVKRALGDLRPNLMATDPPYGVDYDASWRQEVDDSPRYSLGKVLNDDRVDWGDAYRLFPGDVAYVWHAGIHAAEVAISLLSCDFHIRSQIIWRKQVLVMSRGAYHWQHEPCWYAVRKGKSANWQGDRKQSTVWDIANMSNAASSKEDVATGHSTQKPLECMRRPILNHTIAGESVYEPFAGAGTTLVAAELTGRIGIGIELDPRYVSLIVQRFIDMGLDPIREKGSENAMGGETP